MRDLGKLAELVNLERIDLSRPARHGRRICGRSSGCQSYENCGKGFSECRIVRGFEWLR